ncbi:MAG TPA: hypothetical protein VLH19_01555, partial [Patescibacteria group bacterium]|nr:hypothetical protein [Patescibacteria group bacterium]
IIHTDTGLGDFDHHQADRGLQRICATSLVFDYVSHLHPDLAQDEALKYLVEYVTQVDHFEEYTWPDSMNLRYQLMLQNLIDGAKKTVFSDDETVTHFGMQCLDSAYAVLSEQIEAQDEIAKKGITFDTKWGKGLAISSSNDEVVRVAQKSGYVVALRKDIDTGAIRIKAVPGKDIDLTPIYEKIKTMDKTGYWYFHPGKTMLLNGSTKDPSRTPSPLTLDQIIVLFRDVIPA